MTYYFYVLAAFEVVTFPSAVLRAKIFENISKKQKLHKFHELFCLLDSVIDYVDRNNVFGEHLVGFRIP